jgi:hypothetical protein
MSQPLNAVFEEVFVMGMYHSGTNAMIRELTRRFKIPVYPNDGGGFHPKGYWKHTTEASPYRGDPTRLVIVMTKEPFFWLQSLRRRRYDLKLLTSAPTVMESLLSAVELEGRYYPSSLHLWNEYASHYLDPIRFPPENTRLIRFEDFLYRFTTVMEELYTILPARPEIARDTPPLWGVSKQHGHWSRNRKEAEAYYRIYENCYQGLSPSQITEVHNNLDLRQLERLGYMVDAIEQPDTIGNKSSVSDINSEQGDSEVDVASTMQAASEVDLESRMGLASEVNSEVDVASRIQAVSEPDIKSRMDLVSEAAQNTPSGVDIESRMDLASEANLESAQNTPSGVDIESRMDLVSEAAQNTASGVDATSRIQTASEMDRESAITKNFKEDPIVLYAKLVPKRNRQIRLAKKPVIYPRRPIHTRQTHVSPILLEKLLVQQRFPLLNLLR